MSAEKKQRGSWFTEAMTDALVETYGKHQYILQSKFSSSVTNEKKKQAWIKVTTAVNAVNPAERKAVEQIKKKWEDIAGNVKKKKERQARQEELKKMNTTGNGFLADEDDPDSAGPCSEILNQTEQEVARILRPEIFSGIPGGQDTMKLALPKPVSEQDWDQGINNGLCDDNCDALQEVSSYPEINIQPEVMPSTSTNTGAVIRKDNLKALCRKRTKTLSEAQLDYFETVTECYKMKTKKVELEIQMLKEKKDEVYTTISLFSSASWITEVFISFM